MSGFFVSIRKQKFPHGKNQTNTNMETVSNFIDKMVAEFNRSCDLSDPTCLEIAIIQVQKEMQDKRLPLTERQATELLKTKN